MSTRERREAHTQQSIQVRQVTQVQASWTEGARGQDGAFTLQLILDGGAEEYVLRPTADDLDVLVELLDNSENVVFDLERKVLMFGVITTQE